MSAGDDTAVAVVGAGYFAQFHLDAWRRIPGAQLAAICEADPRRREALARESAAPRIFASLAALLEDGEVDLIDIATPPATHLPLARAAADAGLPIICQKPLAPTYEEAVELVESVEAAGVLLAVHENFRFTPWHRETARLIGEGALGELHAISMRLRPGDGQGADAYLARQPYFQTMDRFLIHETAIHWIDTFRFLFGEMSGVFARLRRVNPAIAGEDAGVVVFDFASGASGLFDGNRLNEHPTDNTRRTMGEMWVEGSAGVLRLDGAARLWWKPHGEPEREHGYALNERGFAGDAVHATQAHILSHVRDGTPLENSGRDYLRNLEIEEAVYRSHDEGRWIEV